MDYKDPLTSVHSDIPPDSGPWWSPFYPPQRDSLYTELQQYPHPYRSGSQSSGYSSANLSGCSRPDDCHSLSQSRDFQGNITNNFYFFNSPRAPFSGEHNEIEELNSHSDIPPDSGLWCSPSYPPQSDSVYTELGQYPHLYRSGSQSSGYSSANLSGCSRPDDCHSLSQSRDFQGNITNNFYFFNSPRAPFSGEHGEIEELNSFSPLSVSEQASFGRKQRKVISRHNESLLHEFAPQLVDSMDARAMLPYLMRYGLADRYDQDVISNQFSTDRDRNMHIIRRAPYRNPRAFENFVKCLEAVDPHSELASQLRQRMRKPSSAQVQPAAISQHRYTGREQPSGLHLATRNGGDVVGERLSESHSNEFRQRSHRSEFTESTLVPTQLTIRTNESEDTIYESTLQQYPVHDIEPSSPSASRPMQQNSKVTSEERRQNDQMLIWKKLIWLQNSTAILKSDHEEIQFTSLTNCQEERKVLHSGTLYQQGIERFVVLLTDFLLVLNDPEPRSHLRKAAGKQQFEEHMFSDNKYVANKLLLLHHLKVQDHNKQQDVWLKALSSAIKNSCTVRRKLSLPLGSEVVEGLSGDGQRLSLTILKASALMWPEEDTEYSRRLFCTVMLGQNQPRRTPSVEGKDTTSWNFTFEFWRFTASDTLEIEVWQENTFRPNDFLGHVRVPISAVTDQSTNTVHPGHEMEAALPLKLTASGEINLKICT